MEIPEAIGNHLVADVALEVDDEAIITQSALGRARLQLGQIDVAGRELAEDAMQAPGTVSPLKAGNCGAVVPSGGRYAVAGNRHEPGLILGMVLDVLGQ